MKWLEPLERYIEAIVILWLFDTVFHAPRSRSTGREEVLGGVNSGRTVSDLSQMVGDKIPIALEQPTRLRILWGVSPHTINCLYSDG